MTYLRLKILEHREFNSHIQVILGKEMFLFLLKDLLGIDIKDIVSYYYLVAKGDQFNDKNKKYIFDKSNIFCEHL